MTEPAIAPARTAAGPAPERTARRRAGLPAALALALTAVLPVGAQPTGPPPTPEEAMARTVLDQLAAFRRGDFAAAYAFASAAIQARFAPEAFREMVRRGYAPIARPARSTVRRAELVGPGHGLVEVRVEGEDGETIDALYELVDERGAWRIDGVLATPAPRGPTAALPPAAVRLAAR